VGTNRYAYAGDDPVNGSDRGGHYSDWLHALTGETSHEPDGKVKFESSILLRIALPGIQDSWDRAVSAAYNKDFGRAASEGAGFGLQMGVTLGTLGLGRVAGALGGLVKTAVSEGEAVAANAGAQSGPKLIGSYTPSTA
jgi:hypothetical protein